MDASDCQFSGNEAVNGNGGGIENLGGNLTIEHCTLSGNTASGDSTHGRGGGIDNVNDATTLPTLSVGHSTLSGNTAAYGGGILIVSGSAATTLSQSTISSNVAHGDGGGIHVGYSPLIVINSTIVLNTADNNGGGIYHQDGGGTNVNIYNSTIVGNGADQDEDFNGSGGGVFLIGGSGGSNGFNIYNTILADNIVSNHQEYDDCSAGNDGLGTGVLKTHARNLFGNGINCTTNQISGSYAALTDPSLGVLRNNGGPTQTMALLAEVTP
jgi:hypothetical protein